MNNNSKLYPMKVFYPYGGKHFMLFWEELDEGKNIILSKSKSGIDDCIKYLAEKGATIIQFSEIDIVAPSEELCLKVVKLRERYDIKIFYNNLVSKLLSSGITPGDKSISDLFDKCPSYDDGQPYYCNCNRLKCYCGFLLKGMSLKGFYNKYNNKFQHMFYHEPRENKNGKYSEAINKTSKNISFVTSFSGCNINHANFDKLTINDTWAFSPVLFYFDLISNLDFSEYQSVINSKVSERRENFENRIELEKIKYKEESNKELQFILDQLKL